MAYDPSKLTTLGMHGLPVMSVAQTPGYPRVWTYMSDDANTSVDTAGYFSDAYHRGMSVGDLVAVVTTSASVPSTFYWTIVMAVAASGADLSVGSPMTMTNSD